MRARGLLQVLAITVATVGFTACASTAQIVAPEIPERGATVTLLGLDFSHASFADPYFKADDLVHGKIPDWNHAVTTRILAERLGCLRVQVDERQSAARNASLDVATVLQTQAAVDDGPLDEERVQREIAPYLDPRARDLGIVVIVDRVTKKHHTVAHTVLFDRRSGEIVVAGSDDADGDGFGVSDFYWQALQNIAAHGARMVCRHTS